MTRASDDRSRADRLVTEVRGPVRRFLGRVLRDADLADDVASETCLALLTKWRRSLFVLKPVSYALRVAWRKAQDATIHRRPRARATLDGSTATAPEPFGPDRTEWLERGLADLRPEERAILDLRYDQDLSYAEIARILGCTSGTAGWRLHEAKAALRRALERLGGGTLGGIVLALMTARPSAARAAPAAAGGTTATGFGVLRLGGFAAGMLIMKKSMLVALAVVGLMTAAWVALRTTRDEVPATAPESSSHDDRARLRRTGAGIPATSRPGEAARSDAAAGETRATSTIKGHIVTSLGKAIPGARISYARATVSNGSPRQPEAGRTSSDSDGRFMLSCPSPTAAFDLYAEADGYGPALIPAVLPSDRVLEAVLHAGLALTGTVFDLDERPVHDATVTVTTAIGSWKWAGRGSSDASGRYSVPGIPTTVQDNRALTIGVTVSAPAFAVESFMLDRSPQAGVDDDGAPSVRRDVYLNEGGSISGRVLVGDGEETLPDAEVVFWVADIARAKTRSDAQGRFVLRNVPAAAAGGRASGGQIVADSPGFAPGSCHVGALDAPGDQDADDVRVFRTGVLTGRVIDAGGRPVAGAEVTLSPPAFYHGPVGEPRRLRWSPIASEASGEYRIRDVPCLPGKDVEVSLAAFAPPYRSPWTKATAREETETRAPDLIVGAEPGRCHVFAGRVLDAHDEPIHRARVSFVLPFSKERGAGPPEDVETSEAGSFRLDIPACASDDTVSARVTVSARGYSTIQEDVALPRRESDAPFLMRLALGHRLSGTVRGVDGRPKSDVYLSPLPGQAPYDETAKKTFLGTGVTDPFGRFLITDLPSGPYHLIVSGSTLSRTVVSNVPTDAENLEIVLAPDGAPRGSLSVRIRDARDGSPVKRQVNGALVQDGRRSFAGPLSAPGRFELTGVPAGTYALLLERKHYPPTTISGITIIAGIVSTIDVTLAEGCEVRGVVRLEDGGAPPDPVIVRIRPRGAQKETASVPTKNDGSFSLVGIPPGDYQVSADLAGDFWTPARLVSRGPIVVTVNPGDSGKQVDVTVIPAADLRVDLVDAGNEPKTTPEGIPIIRDPGRGTVLGLIGQGRIRVSIVDASRNCWFEGVPVPVLNGPCVRAAVPPGRYSVIVSVKDHRPLEAAADAPGTVTIPLP